MSAELTCCKKADCTDMKEGSNEMTPVGTSGQVSRAQLATSKSAELLPLADTENTSRID
jgi:hypothetical protein